MSFFPAEELTELPPNPLAGLEFEGNFEIDRASFNLLPNTL